MFLNIINQLNWERLSKSSNQADFSPNVWHNYYSIWAGYNRDSGKDAIKHIRFQTCSRSLSSPITAAVFQSMTSEKGSSQPLLSMTGTQAAYKHAHRVMGSQRESHVLFWLQDSTKRKRMDKQEMEQTQWQIKLLLLNARKAISLVIDTDSKSPAYRRLQINIHFTYTVTCINIVNIENKYVGWKKAL